MFEAVRDEIYAYKNRKMGRCVAVTIMCVNILFKNSAGLHFAVK